MTFNVFLMLMAAFSVLTSLFTEAVKKSFDSLGVGYAANIVVLLASAIVGGLGTSAFYIFSGYEWNISNIICIFLMMVANWLVAMVGYDKVKQAITQLKGGN